MVVIAASFSEKENEKWMKARQKRRMENNLPTEPLNIETDKPEPLRMEHFHLPLGIWMVGTLISLFCFLAEIIGNWIRKKRTGRLSDTEGTELDQVQDIDGY